MAFDFTKENAYAQEVRERWEMGLLKRYRQNFIHLIIQVKQNLSFKLTDFFTNKRDLLMNHLNLISPKEIDTCINHLMNLGYHYTLAAFAN